MQFKRLFKIIHGHNGQHWTKIISLKQGCVRWTIHNRKRPQPTRARAIHHTGKTARAIGHGLAGKLLTTQCRGVVDQLQWPRARRMRGQRLKKFTIATSQHKHAPWSHARLPRVHGARHPNRFGRLVHVGVGKHKRGILPAQFQC